MAASGHLLILLVPVLSLCGATESYVRPTEPTNTSCPAQPCLTLSQYTSDSDHYFKSNTVFKFLPGTHHMDRPVTIGNVHNMSLESLSDEYPHLVAQFPCETEVHDCILKVCCAAVWLHDAYNVTVKGIRITVQAPNISGVVVKNLSGINVQLNIICEISLNKSMSVGIAMFESTSVEVYSTSISNCSYGLNFLDSTNIHITKTTAMYNEIGITCSSVTDTHINDTIEAYNIRKGLYLENANDTYITNMVTTHNSDHGMKLSDMNNTHITNTTATNNRRNGMSLSDLNNTHITNTTAMYNHWNGMKLSDMNNTHITNTTAMYNRQNGMYLSDMNNTHITNTTVTYNYGSGMKLSVMSNTHITNTTTTNNRRSGMYFSDLNNTHITNTTTTYNSMSGMGLSVMSNTHITNTAITYNYMGMELSGMNNTHITNTTATNNRRNRMYLSDLNNTHITNTTAMYNHWNGMKLSDMKNTHITNTTAMYNHWNGMYLSDMNNTHITNTTVTFNYESGMKLSVMSNTHITNTTTTYHLNSGMYLSDLNNTHITNTTITINYMGMVLSGMNNTHITNTTITHNSMSGMGLSVMSNTHITNTTITYNYMGMELSGMNNTHITNTTTTYNYWNGIFLSDMRNTHITKLRATQNCIFEDCKEQVIIFSSAYTLIYSTSFTDISAESASSTADPTSLPAVIALYESTLHVGECNFKKNKISAVRAHASNITVSGILTFSNNKAFAGTAFVLTSDSILTFAENSHIYFLNNHATNTGGVFYITYNNKHMVRSIFPRSAYYPRSTCFLSTEGSRSHTRLTFVNNSAGRGGDILYGGQVAHGLDGDWNCLDSFKNISNISQDSWSLISSDPSRVCLCNGRGLPDCLILTAIHTVYPGQTIYISAVVVGQDFGTVSGTAYAQFLQRGSPPQLDSGQEVQGVTQHNCNNLYYTIFSQSKVSEAVLVLTAQDRYVLKFHNDDFKSALNRMGHLYKTAPEPLVYSNNPIYIDISLLPCPPGFMLTTHSPFKCDCDALLQQIHGVQCYVQKQAIGRSGLLWVGMMQDDSGTNGIVAASEYCSLNYCKREDSNVTLSEPDSQCNYNHSGILCGGCQPGLSLALGSSQCLQCSNNYLALLIPLTMAGPVLVFSIKIMDLTISQGTLNGLIFYANIIKANEYIFLPRGQTNPLTVFIAWLNLGMGVETCLFQGLTAYSKTWLQFVFPFYIWSIAGLIIILARYSDRVAKVLGNNSVPVLATLFLLSYAKLLRTIITALSYTVVYTSHGPKAVWTADGNVDYLGPQHAPLFTTAVAVLLFLWLPYTLLLFLGQWLHRCNCRLILHLLMKIKPILDAHYGCLKGKYHYWFGALLLVRAVILLISALVPANRSSIVLLCVSIAAAVLTHFGHLVYCNLAVAMFDTTFFLNLVLLTGAYSFTTTAGGGVASSTYTLIGVAFVQFVGLVFFKMFSIFKQSGRLRCLHKKKHAEDDWELYEEAALQREMEPDSEEEGSEGSGSIESLPTY